MKRLLILCFFFSVTGVNAQQNSLSEQELMAIVSSYHPVAKQTGLSIRIADAEVTSSRAAFDPQWQTMLAEKTFDGTKYYDQRLHEIKIPTWYGIDLYAGAESIQGSRLNPEETRGSTTYVGVSVSVLQNLLMDKRRAVLLKAKNFRSQSEVQQKIILNDLMQEALNAYWQWWADYQVYDLLSSTLRNAETRFGMTKTAFQLGDRPAIDTLEAFTQVQTMQVRVSEGLATLQRSRLELSTFLWTADEGQYDLPPGIRPQPFQTAAVFNLDELLNFAETHPEIVEYNYKLRGLQIDQRLAFQSLLPDLRLKYNQMGTEFGKTFENAWFENNYRYGLGLSVPLRFSQGRGEYRKAKLRIESNALDQENKKVSVFTKVKQYYTEWQQLEKQLSLQENLVNSVRRLQRGEETRFANGESSLFLINTRELKTIESEQKLIEMRSKLKKTVAGLRWSAGVLAGN